MAVSYPKCSVEPRFLVQARGRASKRDRSAIYAEPEEADLHLDAHATPLPDFRDAHAPVRLPTDRDLVQPRSRVQAGAKSIAAPLVRANPRNMEVLTDPQPVNAVGNLAVLAWLLNSWTEIGVLERDEVSIAAGGIDNLTVRERAVGVSPVAPTTTIGGGQVGDLLAISVYRCWRKLSYREPRASIH